MNNTKYAHELEKRESREPVKREQEGKELWLIC